MAEFHWLRPEWLWALPLCLLVYALLRRLKPQAHGWEQLIAPHLLRRLEPLTQQKRHSQWHILLTTLCALSLLAAAGPSWQQLPQPAFALKKATVIVLDMSLSMRASDMKPNRLTQARFKALEIANQLPEGDLALIAFAGDAFVISPLTPDHNNVALLIPDLKPEVMPVQGSDLLSALKKAGELLQQAGYPRGDVFVLTDGFNSDEHTEIVNYLDSYPHRVSILGFGTEDGAPITLENGELYKDTQGVIAVPRLPWDALTQMARKTSGVAVQFRVDNQDIEHMLQQPPLDLNQDVQTDSRFQGDQWQDGGVFLVWALLIGLALWLRRYSHLLLILCLLTPPDPAMAATPLSSLWLTPDEQGLEHYQAGEFDQARQQFQAPLWQGNAAYRAGDYPAASQWFQQDTSAEGRFNLGNSLAQQQQYQQALEAYQQAEKLNPNLAGLAQNKQLMEQLLQKQQQQDQQQNQQSSSSKDSSKDKSKQQGEQQDQANSEQSDSQQGADSQPANDSNQNAAGEDKQQQQDQQAEQEPDTKEQQQTEQQAMKAEAEKQQEQAIKEAWPNATPEQAQQLDNLLRKVHDDPSLLLRNKMYLEYQKRQQQGLPRGVGQQW